MGKEYMALIIIKISKVSALSATRFTSAKRFLSHSSNDFYLQLLRRK
jgi:hypothetical protein